MTSIISTNPSLDYESIWNIEMTGSDALSAIVSEAHQAKKLWGNIPVSDRVSYLRNTYEVFDTEREIIAKSISQEMGMPIRQARDEVQYGMMYFSWYLDNALKYLSPEVTRETESELHTVYYEPKWVVAAIAPWNYPFSMMIWTSMQALLAGNSVIFKTSKEVILTGKLISDLIEKSNLPKWVWTEVYGNGELGNELALSDIDFITFTGSTRVGRWLAQIAQEKWIGCVMELGGSAPGIVLKDADIDSVIDTIYFLRYSNSGQMCDGLKRLIVEKSRYEEVVEKLIMVMKSKKIGIAMEESIDIWPLVSEAQLHHLEEQYQDALAKWAILRYQSDIDPSLKGAYFTPSLFTGITKDMKIWKEEVFGPILPVISCDTIEEAIELANDTAYGLGAYVFTEDRETFQLVARNLRSGMVQMNNLNYCIPESPFGGYKSSGIGREHGKWGFHEFCNIKVTSIPK
jgi:succinate-semialdehyde dehydrogenase / glutarate-semialdehyde dehydrogenase